MTAATINFSTFADFSKLGNGLEGGNLRLCPLPACCLLGF